MEKNSLKKKLKDIAIKSNETRELAANFPFNKNKSEYFKLQELARNLESEVNCLVYYDSPIFFKKEDFKNQNLDDIYIDQAYQYLKTPNFQTFSSYTPFGVKNLEGFFIKQITSFDESNYTKAELEQLILRNPHLHNIIKTNLLGNLNKLT